MNVEYLSLYINLQVIKNKKKYKSSRLDQLVMKCERIYEGSVIEISLFRGCTIF